MNDPVLGLAPPCGWPWGGCLQCVPRGTAGNTRQLTPLSISPKRCETFAVVALDTTGIGPAGRSAAVQGLPPASALGQNWGRRAQSSGRTRSRTVPSITRVTRGSALRPPLPLLGARIAPAPRLAALHLSDCISGEGRCTLRVVLKRCTASRRRGGWVAHSDRRRGCCCVCVSGPGRIFARRDVQ